MRHSRRVVSCPRAAQQLPEAGAAVFRQRAEAARRVHGNIQRRLAAEDTGGQMQRQDMPDPAETPDIGRMNVMQDAPGIPRWHNQLKAGHVAGQGQTQPVGFFRLSLPVAIFPPGLFQAGGPGCEWDLAG